MKRVFRKTTWRRAAGVVAGLAVAWIAAQVMPPRGAVPGRNPFRAREDGRALAIAHGGGLGLHPENTLEAFTASAARGCDLLENLRISRPLRNTKKNLDSRRRRHKLAPG
jgi:hypothetical protein